MSTKIHLVCQIGLGKPLWARVFKACVATVITASGIVTERFICCCKRIYVATVITASGIVTLALYSIDIFSLVATVITASGIVTRFQYYWF